MLARIAEFGIVVVCPWSWRKILLSIRLENEIEYISIVFCKVRRYRILCLEVTFAVTDRVTDVVCVWRRTYQFLCWHAETVLSSTE